MFRGGAERGGVKFGGSSGGAQGDELKVGEIFLFGPSGGTRLEPRLLISEPSVGCRFGKIPPPDIFRDFNEDPRGNLLFSRIPNLNLHHPGQSFRQNPARRTSGSLCRPPRRQRQRRAPHLLSSPKILQHRNLRRRAPLRTRPQQTPQLPQKRRAGVKKRRTRIRPMGKFRPRTELLRRP